MQFSIHPQLDNYDSFQNFVETEQLTDRDLILTNEFIYTPFMKDLNLTCKVLFQETFGAGEPNDEMIDTIRSRISEDIDRIIAVGGGTVIDIAKTLVFREDFKTLQLFTGKKVPRKSRLLYVIPTTCGTGSEVTNLTIAELKSLNTKKGVGLPSMFADKAILIPEMVKTLPYKFFATSSIDALIHAVESMVSPKSTIHTELFAEKAISLIIGSYVEVVEKGLERWTEYAEEFLFASNYAGIAFGNAGVGAVHALSYPLGGAYHIPHGEANQLMFIDVFKAYKDKQPEGSINRVEKIIAEKLGTDPDQAFTTLDELMQKILKRKPLKEYGISKMELAAFSRSVIEGQQRLLANNYVELTEEEIHAIYKACY